LSLLHGAAPAALLLCHQVGRESIRAPRPRAGATPAPPGPDMGAPVIPPLPDLVREYEQAAAWVRPATVVGVALHTLGLDDGAARQAVAAAARVTGLPACDPVRFGSGPLADALCGHLEARRRHATAT
jgi:uncharacterized NAD-dependent epimerase/dehydratase family protein